jgi:hypothetical protein
MSGYSLASDSSRRPGVMMLDGSGNSVERADVREFCGRKGRAVGAGCSSWGSFAALRMTVGTNNGVVLRGVEWGRFAVLKSTVA